jgi:hypothetical protein
MGKKSSHAIIPLVYIIEDQAFSPSYDLAPYPSPLSCQQIVSLSQASCVSPMEHSDWKGGRVREGVRRQTIKRQERLVLYNPFTTLWRAP